MKYYLSILFDEFTMFSLIAVAILLTVSYFFYQTYSFAAVSLIQNTSSLLELNEYYIALKRTTLLVSISSLSSALVIVFINIKRIVTIIN